MSTPDLVVRELLPLLRRFCPGEHGIALGGSHAKGSGDVLSDLDVYLFADRVLPGARRREQVVEALGEAAEAVSWGCDDPFTGGGTDFTYRGTRVECWLRSTRQMQATIAACTTGELRREHSVWAVMGFFDHVALADVLAMRIVEDPRGMLARWKAEVAVYPEPLRRAVLGRFMPEATFWPDNRHYASAVERADVIYVSAIVQQVAQALVQVVFALNGEYFPGEKRLDTALEKLQVAPHALARRLRGLLFPGKDPGVAELREQRRALGALVAEVERLVAAHGGPA